MHFSPHVHESPAGKCLAERKKEGKEPPPSVRSQSEQRMTPLHIYLPSTVRLPRCLSPRWLRLLLWAVVSGTKEGEGGKKVPLSTLFYGVMTTYTKMLGIERKAARRERTFLSRKWEKGRRERREEEEGCATPKRRCTSVFLSLPHCEREGRGGKGGREQGGSYFSPERKERKQITRGLSGWWRGGGGIGEFTFRDPSLSSAISFFCMLFLCSVE